MLTAPPIKFFKGFSLLLAIQVGFFVLFHLNVGQIFDIEFVKLILAYEWPRSIYYFGDVIALYSPAAIFVWMIFATDFSKVLLVAMTLGTLYYACYWHYPLLTGFLFSIGQFDSHGAFVFRYMPGISQYPSL